MHQVEIPGSYGQLQNHNLETFCCVRDLSMTHLLEQLLVVGIVHNGCNWVAIIELSGTDSNESDCRFICNHIG